MNGPMLWTSDDPLATAADSWDARRVEGMPTADDGGYLPGARRGHRRPQCQPTPASASRAPRKAMQGGGSASSTAQDDTTMSAFDVTTGSSPQ